MPNALLELDWRTLLYLKAEVASSASLSISLMKPAPWVQTVEYTYWVFALSRLAEISSSS